MYLLLGLIFVELKVLILIIRILIKVNVFLEEYLCGIYILMCGRKVKKKSEEIVFESVLIF